MLSLCSGSLDSERRYNSSSRPCDTSPVLLPDCRESVGVPDHSTALHYNNGHDVAVEDEDSKEEVVLCHSCITCTVTVVYWS